MLQRGDKIGDYTLVKFLGRGQFGVVWLAEKEIAFSQRKFRHALKFLPQGDDAGFNLIQAEIDTWIEASGHPNVMSVLDMMVYDNHIIIASEYADGGSLMDWLRRTDGKAPTVEKALEMMTGILSGIEHLHSRNVIHRDLKPDNILLQGNTPRITDFGISRIVSANSLSAVAMGSPYYMSPESFDGGKSPQTDIWSAGVMLYEMLTGNYPYKADSMYGLVTKIRQEQPLPMPESIPPELRVIVETALQKDLSRRYRSARDMRSVVQQEIFNLKAREKKLAAEKMGPGWVDPTAITLFDAKLDLSELELELEPEVESTAHAVPVPAGRDTQEVDGASSAEALEVETQRRIPDAPPMIVTHTDVAVPIWKNPAVIAFGVGGAFVILLSVSLISFFSAAKTIVTSVAETSNTNTAPVTPAVPKAPDGMVYVPGGDFMMGRDNGASIEESPAHRVTVKPFFIDIYEVTNEQYLEFVKKTNHRTPSTWKGRTFPSGQDRYPVVGVTWKDATAYAEWAGKRLPTEEEWEFAARGTDGFLYPWGNEWNGSLANAGGTKTFVEVGTTTGVSPFGVFDMVGNAGEWTADDFKPYEGGTLPERYAGKTQLKTIRGSSYDLSREFSAATYRAGYSATGEPSYEFTGFRCARDQY